MAADPPLPRPEPGTVSLLLTDAHVRLVLAGELDLLIKAELLKAVQEAARYDRPVEVDARHVTFMDSSAIATLSRLVQLTGHRPIFISPPEVVRFLLQVTRIGDLVDIVDHDSELATETPGAGISVEAASPGRASA